MNELKESQNKKPLTNEELENIDRQTMLDDHFYSKEQKEARSHQRRVSIITGSLYPLRKKFNCKMN